MATLSFSLWGARIKPGFKSRLMNEGAAANVVIGALDARGMVVDSSGDDHIVSELAAGTGGSFFHHSNDLEGGLKRLASPQEDFYLRKLSLKGIQPDGVFHPLQVKVNQRGMPVQAR